MLVPQSLDVEAHQPLSRSTTITQYGTCSETDKDVSLMPPKHWLNLSFAPNPRMVSDSILGLSDGLTVPFALTAGLAAMGSTKVVILGGLAELMAGAISMGLGGYVGAKSEDDSYRATERKCNKLIQTSPIQCRLIVQEYFQRLEICFSDAERISKEIECSPEALKTFLMEHHFETSEPDTGRPYISALTLAISYFIGGFIPLIPYFIVPQDQVSLGLWWSIGVMGIVLLVFGYLKTGIVRGWSGKENLIAGVLGALQMLIVGAIAAGAAVGLVRAVNGNESSSILTYLANSTTGTLVNPDVVLSSSFSPNS